MFWHSRSGSEDDATKAESENRSGGDCSQRSRGDVGGGVAACRKRRERGAPVPAISCRCSRRCRRSDSTAT